MAPPFLSGCFTYVFPSVSIILMYFKNTRSFFSVNKHIKSQSFEYNNGTLDELFIVI